MADNGIKLVGYLQSVNKPFVSLLLDTVKKTIILRIFHQSRGEVDYIVTPEQVLGYMDGDYGLGQIAPMEPKNSMFVEELCNEQSRIMYFLHHIDNYVR